MKKAVLGAIVGTTSVAITASISLGITLPLLAKLKDGVEKFVLPGGGPSNTLKDKKEINYVALGDSVASGHVGFLNKSEVSYTDYLTKSLQNHNIKINYNNFAVSGARVPDLQKTALQTPAVIDKLQDADLITITIGGNDILAYLEMFGLPYSDFNSMLALYLATAGQGGGNYSTIINGPATDNEGRDEAFPGTNQKETPETVLAKVNKSLNIAADVVSGTKTNADIFGFNEDVGDKLRDSIQKSYAGLMFSLNTLAPNARIVVVSPPNPYRSFGDKLINEKTTRIEGGAFTISEYFKAVMDSIEKGVTKGYDGKTINFTDYVYVDGNDKYLSKVKNEWDDIQEYMTKQIYVDNAMPNIADIHPSMYGYDLMGEIVLDQISKDLNLTVEENKIQHSIPWADKTAANETSPWLRIDENPANAAKGVATQRVVKSLTTIYKAHETIDADKTEEIVESLVPAGNAERAIWDGWTNTEKQTYIDDQFTPWLTRMEPILKAHDVKTLRDSVVKSVDDLTGTDTEKMTKLYDLLGKLINGPATNYRLLSVLGMNRIAIRDMFNDWDGIEGKEDRPTIS